MCLDRVSVSVSDIKMVFYRNKKNVKYKKKVKYALKLVCFIWIF